VVHVFTNKALACSIPALLGSRAPLVCYRGTTGHLSAWDPGSWFSYRHPRVSAVIGFPMPYVITYAPCAGPTRC
jgi:hypothetical protein